MNPLPSSDEAEVERLLADPAHAGHPLRAALDALWQDHQQLLRRLERITQLSDSVQSMAHLRDLSRERLLDRQLRQLEKITRISDRYQNMMRELNVALTQASTHDLLTGLANRRLLGERLHAERERSDRAESTFCVALADVDRFKRINDTYGHDVGDRVLCAIGSAMQDSVREYDLCGRWGGEEFLLLLPATTLERSRLVVARVLDAVHALHFDDVQPALQVSVSIGIAEHAAGETIETLVKRADEALLQAKRDGRDRSVFSAG